MRISALLGCAAVVAAVVAAVAGAAEPAAGTLSVENGKGVVVLDLRGSVLGRLKLGTLRVTDYTPRDAFSEIVVGRRLTQEQIGPRTILYRGSSLRFRMLGGGYRVVARGFGIDISAVGRGFVILDGDPTFSGENVGTYSLDGVDCGFEPLDCKPLPSESERFTLGANPADSPSRAAAG